MMRSHGFRVLEEITLPRGLKVWSSGATHGAEPAPRGYERHRHDHRRALEHASYALPRWRVPVDLSDGGRDQHAS
jgi:hypothetical protein